MSTDSYLKAFAAPLLDANGKRPLIGLFLSELEDVFKEMGWPKFRAKQVWHWIYQRGVSDFEEMGNVPKDIRAVLIEQFTIARPEIITEQKSVDGTMKWLLRMSDGQEVETVFIPEEKRGTLCISSQVGCTLSCKFCHTGTQALVRNLGVNEIV